MNHMHDLHQLGQSTWLNDLRNSFLRSGELAERMEQGIQGLTANALAYERAIAGGDYDAAIRAAVAGGMPVRRIHQTLMVDDIQRAADALRPIFDATDRLDGFVSLELDPGALHNATETVAEVRHLSHLIDRYNVMVEVPATVAGTSAIRELTADGVSVNATHIFSVAQFERVAAAYLEGLEETVQTHSVWRATPTAVASFSLSPIDDEVDRRLRTLGREDLCGKTAIAIAKVLYARFRERFSGERWDYLASRRGRVMRPKWTRTSPRDYRLSPTHYVDALIGPNTVTTFSPATFTAFLASSHASETLAAGFDDARAHLAEIAGLDIDLDALAEELQRAHLRASDRQYQALAAAVMTRRDELDRDWSRLQPQLGPYMGVVEEGLQKLCNQRIICRIWSHDHAVWKPEPKEIANRLGWLHVGDTMLTQASRLAAYAQSLVDEGYTHALLLGMGGSSLAPELFYRTFGRPARPPYQPYPYLDLVVLDTTDPEVVHEAAAALDLSKTLVIVATKSGGTVETLSGFKAFYNRMVEAVGDEAGRHFVAITDPGSSLVDLATRYGFRDIFLNDPNIGGRYSALSYFGLMPAALVGVDVETLLHRAGGATANAMLCDCETIHANDAAAVGTTMGRLAAAGRDKVTFISSPALASFGDWVEQLIAESTGKEGRGILPVVGEPIAAHTAYGSDRLFVHLRLDGDASQDAAVAELAAVHPVLTLRLRDTYDVGAQFFVWEMATAVAGYWLRINPFDQPNVESAKVLARQVVETYRKTGALPAGTYAPATARALSQFLGQARRGDYIAIQAYVPTTPEIDAALQALRQSISARTDMATTVGYGPRFLHSTGQLHKGDRGNGLFVQLVSSAVEDEAIPDEAGRPESAMTFGVLKEAQALGDAEALRDAGRRVLSVHLGSNPVAGLRDLLH